MIPEWVKLTREATGSVGREVGWVVATVVANVVAVVVAGKLVAGEVLDAAICVGFPPQAVRIRIEMIIPNFQVMSFPFFG